MMPHCWSRGSRIHRGGHSHSLGALFVGTCFEPRRHSLSWGDQDAPGEREPHKARVGNWAILGRRRRERVELETYLRRQADIPWIRTSRFKGPRRAGWKRGLYIKLWLALVRHGSTEMGGSGYVDCSSRSVGGQQQRRVVARQRGQLRVAVAYGEVYGVCAGGLSEAEPVPRWCSWAELATGVQEKE